MEEDQSENQVYKRASFCDADYSRVTGCASPEARKDLCHIDVGRHLGATRLVVLEALEVLLRNWLDAFVEQSFDLE